jgi:hypothetical protein
MFLTKRSLPRRTFLRGMGVTIALPLLDAMLPAQTPLSKSAATPRTRLCCIEMVHGAAGSTGQGSLRHYWAPEKEGRDFKFSLSLEPLAPYRDYITIVSHTDLEPAEAYSPAEEGADHFRSSAVYLTATHPKLTLGSDYLAGTSIDQLYAQQFGQDTPLPSIQLCIEMVDGSGVCDYGYACIYADTISWSSSTGSRAMSRAFGRISEQPIEAGSTPISRTFAKSSAGCSASRSITRTTKRRTFRPHPLAFRNPMKNTSN